MSGHESPFEKANATNQGHNLITSPPIIAASIVGRKLADLIVGDTHTPLEVDEAAELAASLRLLLARSPTPQDEALRVAGLEVVTFAALRALTARAKADLLARRAGQGGALQ